MTYQDVITINVTSPVTKKTISVSGFSEIEITRGIEEMPSHFTLRTTDKYPNQNALAFNAYDSCQILIGSDVVLTGYIQRIDISYNAQMHELIISGASKCTDIVSCAALFLSGSQLQQIKSNPQAPLVLEPDNLQNIGGQTQNANIKQVASLLCAPYGITVSQYTALANPIVVPYIQVNLGDTVFELLEQMARWYGVLLYDDVNGNLVISQIGNSIHTGTLTNDTIQEAQVSFDNAERYNQNIAVFLPTMGTLGVQNGNGNPDIAGNAIDSFVYRYRPRILPASVYGQQTASGIQSFANLEAQWTRDRSIGRSQVATITVPFWRDAAGLLWQPNYLINIDAPALKIVSSGLADMNIDGGALVIAKVTYKKSIDTGTTAVLEVMPQTAFAVEPINLNQTSLDISNDTDTSNSSNTNTTPNTQPKPTIPNPIGANGSDDGTA